MPQFNVQYLLNSKENLKILVYEGKNVGEAMSLIRGASCMMYDGKGVVQ